MADTILADVESSGIYQIRNLVNGNRYVGSAVNIRNRWAAHRHRLRNGDHHSRHLQSAWNKYGEFSFEFSILEICARGSLICREQFHIDKGCEYNKSKTAGSPLGVKWSNEARERASERRTGVPKSDSHIEKMRSLTANQWANESLRKRMSDGIKRSYDSSLLDLRRISQKRNWEDPEVSQKIRGGIKKSYTPELRTLRSEQSKARWADPNFRARMLEIRRKKNP